MQIDGRMKIFINDVRLKCFLLSSEVPDRAIRFIILFKDGIVMF